VLSAEPPRADHPLPGAPNVVITPHLGWATRAARERLLRRSIENVQAFLRGRPQNEVGGG
jgi:glycerate dehydrogenase